MKFHSSIPKVHKYTFPLLFNPFTHQYLQLLTLTYTATQSLRNTLQDVSKKQNNKSQQISC